MSPGIQERVDILHISGPIRICALCFILWPLIYTYVHGKVAAAAAAAPIQSSLGPIWQSSQRRVQSLTHTVLAGQICGVSIACVDLLHLY